MFPESGDITSIVSRFINHTCCPVFLTGKAGTGKTTFLKEIVETTHKNVVVAAPTGVAAINAGGVTLHSLFQLPFGSFVPDNNPSGEAEINFELNTPRSLLREIQMHSHRRKLIQELELLIIDEVSMLRADLLDAIDTVLRHVRRQKNLPFGGIQMLFIGDLLQLPPVIKEEEAKFLSRYYPSLYFFDAKALQHQNLLHIELEKIYRQTDQQFITILNRIRDNRLTFTDLETLNRHYQPDIIQKIPEGYIFLTTHNRRADEINSGKLKQLEGKTFSFEAIVADDFPENSYPVEFTLQLKEGAQVMFIKNDPSGDQQFFNGKIGFVSEISDEEIIVSFNDGSADAVVEPYTWENKRFFLNTENGEIEEKVIGKFIHYPLKLAWAITIHKSQGLTFRKAIIDVAGAFAPGQVYVALSRLESLDGLILTSRIPATGLDPENALSQFIKTKDHPENLDQKLQTESVKYISEIVNQNFDLSGIIHSLKFHIESYDKDEKRSEKQKHNAWAQSIYDEFSPVADVASKFIVQAKAILNSGKIDKLTLLHQRILAANGYFNPLLKGFSEKVALKTGTLKSVKGIKTYQNELKEVEFLFERQVQRLVKAESLVRVSLNNDMLTKSELQKSTILKKQEIPAVPKKNKDLPEKQIKSKPEKQDTRKISYDYFKNGKTISEIASERNLKVTTIEGHLAHYVATGLLNPTLFISVEKIEKVAETAKKLDSYHLGPIREVLGNDYSYSDIRFAIAGYLANRAGDPEITD